MGIIEAVKKGFSVATKNMGLLVILIGFNLIFNLASLPLTVQPGATPSPQLAVVALIFSIAFVLISIFIQGGSLGLVRDYLKQGKMVLGNLTAYGFKYYVKLLGLGILILLIVAIVALIAGIIVAVTAPLNNPVITTIAVIIAVAIGVIAGLLFFVPLAMSPYAIVCEEVGIIEAMKRSLQVVRNPFSRVFMVIALFIVLILISLGIGLIVGFIVGIVSGFLPAGLGQVLMGIATSIINGFLGLVMMASFMAFYLNLTGKDKVATEKVL